MVVCVLFLYIGYNCLVSYCTRRKVAKEKQHRRIVEHVETKLRPTQRAIEMSPTAPTECACAHMHIPDYQVQNQNTARYTQQSPTFEWSLLLMLLAFFSLIWIFIKTRNSKNILYLKLHWSETSSINLNRPDWTDIIWNKIYKWQAGSYYESQDGRDCTTSNC